MPATTQAQNFKSPWPSFPNGFMEKFQCSLRPLNLNWMCLWRPGYFHFILTCFLDGCTSHQWKDGPHQRKLNSQNVTCSS